MGEAIRWALLPNTDNTSFPQSPEYSQLSANIDSAAADLLGQRWEAASIQP